MRRIFMAAVAAGLIGVAPLGVQGCGQVAQGVLAAAPAFLIGDRQEVALGLEAARDVVTQTPIYGDPKLKAYVQNLGERIARTTNRSNLPWTFTVLQADAPDAFALPGGFIFLTTGMISRMKDEAELAGVLAHEVGHVAEKHSVEMIRQAALIQGVGSAVIGEDGGATALLANVVATLVLRGYGREKELEADRVGARYATNLGYDPTALGDMLTKLNREGGGAPTWLQPLSTHPTLEERLNGLNTTISQLGGGGGGGGSAGTSRGRGDTQAFLDATASLR